MEEQIRKLASAAPLGAKITVTIELMGTGTEPRGGTGPAGGAAPSAPSGDTSPSAAGATLMERLEAHAAASGEALTAARWGALLIEIPGREIERAVGHGLLAEVEKGYGRDHRARVISVESMRAYVSTCAQVAQGHIKPLPSWWHNVRKGENANIAA